MPSPAVSRLRARVRRGLDRLELSFSLQGDLARLRIPSAPAPGRADRLWEHTCFEAFLAPKEGASYCEFNFAPSGAWAAYAFRRYREAEPWVPTVEPVIVVRVAGDRLELDCLLSLERMPGIAADAPLRLALSAVVEDAGGNLSYWALAHPSAKPDFHHPASFVLELGPPPKEGVVTIPGDG
ncbi:MAG TPA: DOMON-like domain-containing protein [Methylococcus sp.]|nr:DOMON-like domain-containing protein [Methylococcus sp.]